MSQYNFIQPQEQPSWTQGLAGAINTTIQAIRQKKANEQDQANKDRQFGLEKQREDFNEGESTRRDIENGWSPATSSNAGGVPQTSSHPQPPAPEDPNAFAPAPASAAAPSGPLPSLAAAIGQVRQQRAAAPMMGNAEEQASGMSSGYDGNDTEGDGDTDDAAPGTTSHDTNTNSGLPADPRVGPAPTAGDVHFGGMAFNPNATPAARQSMLAAEIERQREVRQRGYASEDRSRQTGELQAAGVAPGRAAAEADKAIPYSDTQDNPEHFTNEQKSSDIDLGRGIALERERRKTAIAEHTLGEHDQTDRDIDKYADDAQKDVMMGQAALGALQKRDTSLMSPEDLDKYNSDVAQAQSELNDAKTRYKHYQGIVDARVNQRSGTPPQASTGKKQPTQAQIDRMSKDPQYREYLAEQGYDLSSGATGGAFKSPFRLK